MCSFFATLPSSSLCKGRTLYSVVRDAKVALDVNKTRQIAQEMVKVKLLTADSRQHFIVQEGQKQTCLFLPCLCVCVCVFSGDGLPPRQGNFT